MGLEGIVSKRLGAPYRSGPSRDWLPYPASNHPYRKVGCRGQDAARRGRGQGAVGGDAADAGLQLPGDRCQKHRWPNGHAAPMIAGTLALDPDDAAVI
jgi:hypothetical protein